MYREVETKEIIILVVISLVVSCIVFLLTEIIWGDLFKTFLRTSYKQNQYNNINIILITGLGFIFFVSILVNMMLFRDYTTRSKVRVNILSFIITFLILFMIASLTVIITYSRQYAGLSVVDKMRISWLFFAYFSVYILPSPILFWFLALVIFHVVLFILMRFLLVKEIRMVIKVNHKRDENEKQIKKYKILG